MKIKKAVIIGATSAVAVEVSRMLTERAGATPIELILVGRDRGGLHREADDLRARGAQVDVIAGQVADPAAFPASELFEASSIASPIDLVVVAFGSLSDEARARDDPAYLASELHVNFVACAGWAQAAASHLQRQDHGVLAVIGSVAGDRGRASNYAYGAAKAGLATFVQGLAHRLASGRARAMIVKPGFIDTPMTAHLEKGGLLWATPTVVAAAILAAVPRGRPVVYAPGFWRWILLVIRALPASIFHRTKL
jgi:decaprenylphospho-beta-D-erythro-pentofuranosid-2-ulose 2-reductase